MILIMVSIDTVIIIDVLYGDDSCPAQLQSQSSVGGFRVRKLGKFAHSRNRGGLSEGHVN